MFLPFEGATGQPTLGKRHSNVRMGERGLLACPHLSNLINHFCPYRSQRFTSRLHRYGSLCDYDRGWGRELETKP